ncbi:amino acid adenylation domain-containing protein [Paenibacillus oleatilyticus]|uniref:Amino acid adenylation domain-containing protein n=1 Tax=Paenibacillus oleatilyticus TaxID=2594886 RepID=A0ABV4VA66_9BACL
MKFAHQVYWLNRMRQYTKKTYIVSDLVSIPEDMQAIQTVEQRLSPSVSDGILRLGQHSSLSVFILFVAVMKSLLHKYSGERDIVVGIPLFPGTEQKDMLPLRTHIKPETAFRDIVLQVKDGIFESYRHPDFSVMEIAELLGLSAWNDDNPFFDIAIRSTKLHGATPAALKDGCAICVEIDERECGIVVRAFFSSRIYKETSVKGLLHLCQRITESALKDPMVKLQDVEWMTDAERQRILNDFYRQGTFGVEAPIHTLFERQVMRTPQKVAVMSRNTTLTYDELNRRANRLAARLLSNSPRSRFIGVLMDRDTEYLVAILAILKAGRGFVPLDPTYPPERLQYMITQSGIDMIITDLKIRTNLHVLFNDPDLAKKAICFSEEEFMAYSADNPEQEVSLRDPAYMIFTSGSTGLPKGAVIRHDGAINHIYAQKECMELGDDIVFLQSAPASSDISIWQFLSPPLLGGTTAIIDKDTLLNAEAMFAFIRRHQVTVLEFVPPLLEMMVEYAASLKSNTASLTSLKWIMATGETVSVRLLNALLVQFPHVKIANAYGPSEASDDTIQFITAEPLPICEARVPIGQSLPNVRIHILDTQRRMVPIGVPGEIYVSGVAVGDGYWLNEQKTIECFMPNPYLQGEMMYKTGDAGRWLTSGDIDFLGRLDEQLNINGYRIEPGDIETKILCHHAVRQCVVVAKVATDNNIHYLVAYIVLKYGQSLIVSEMREYLNNCLPRHMIPAHFIVMDAIPLTPSGKTDRQALIRRLDHEHIQHAAPTASPRDETEQLLYELWLDTLQTDRIGIHDDFFELGGDSIQSIQIVAKAKARGIQMTPKDIFDHLTIARIAEALTRRVIAGRERPVLTGPVPLTPIQRWFFELRMKVPNHFNQAILLDLEPRLTSSMVSQVFASVFRQHDALRMFFPRDTVANVGIGEASDFFESHSAFALADLSGLPKERRAQTVEALATKMQTSINIEEPPLCKCAYFVMGEGESPQLLLVIHHLIVDAISWQILLDDLQTGFHQVLQGKEVMLKESTTSFADWARMLKQAASSPSILEQAPQWKEILGNAVQSGGLARYRELPPGIGRTFQFTFALSEESTRRCVHLLPRFFHARLQEVLLAVWMESMHQTLELSSLMVDIESHGRDLMLNEIDLSRTVGWFTCLFPVLLQRRDGWDYSDAVQNVRMALSAIPGNGLGYGILRYLSEDPALIQPADEFSRAGVRFNYLGQTDSLFSSDLLFKISSASGGESIAADNRTQYALDVNCVIFQGCLRFQFIYNDAAFNEKEIEKLAVCLKQEFNAIIDYCEAHPLLQYSIFDFPQTEVRRTEIERIIAEHVAKSDKAEHGEIEDIYPLTPMQNAILFHNIFYSSHGLNSQQIYWLLEGEMNEEAYRRAWQAVIDAHPVLRTSFRWRRLKEPVQIVYRTMQLHFGIVDWTKYSFQEQQDRLSHLIGTGTGESITPTEYPLIRFQLIRLSKQRHIFMIRYSTSLFDNWSWKTIMQDVMSAYKQAASGDTVDLPVRKGFGEYVKWLRKGNVSNTKLFWQRELSSLKCKEAPALPRTNSGFSPQETEVEFTKAETQAAELLTQQYGITMNSLLQAVWALVWCSYDQSHDALYSVLSSGRTPEVSGIDMIVGPFSNLLPVRSALTDGMIMSEWIKQIQDKQIEAIQHDYVAPDQLSKWTNIPVERFQTAIYERGFIYIGESDETYLNNIPRDGLVISQVSSTLSHHVPLRAYGLRKDTLLVSLKYNQFQFSPEQIGRMVNRLKWFFTYVIRNMDYPICLEKIIMECQSFPDKEIVR